MSTRPNVLVIAEAANPEWVSVPLVGWSLATALRDVANVHIATQIRNRDAFLRAGLREGRDFTAIDSEAVARQLWRLTQILRMGRGKGWTTGAALSALGYLYFERLLWARFGDDLKMGRFDLVHRVTPLSPTVSSPIAKHCQRAGVSFVMGPINGGLPWPKGFGAERRREREWLSYVRDVYKLMPGRSATLDAASAIIVGSRHTESEMPARVRDKCFYLPENAVDLSRFSLPPRSWPAVPETASPLRGCFIGRLVPYKGPDMLIEAAAPLMRAGRFRLDVIGDGPMAQSLKAQAEQEGVTDAITFHGQLPHHDVQDITHQADLLTFPSVREFGGGVILEAMALGVVPVVVDYGGPGELVDEAVGFKIPIGPRSDIVTALRRKLEEIAAAPTLLPTLSAAAATRVRDRFTWTAKATQITEIYEWVLARKSHESVAHQGG